jgi:hypothetical protein
MEEIVGQTAGIHIGGLTDINYEHFECRILRDLPMQVYRTKLHEFTKWVQ